MKFLTLLPVFVEVALALSVNRGYKRYRDHGRHANKTEVHSSAYHHHKPHHDHGCSNDTHKNDTHLPPHDNTSYTSPLYTPPSDTDTSTTTSSTPQPSMTTSTTTALPTTTTPAGGSESASYIQDALDGHNKLRAQHGADPLTWSDTVAKAAETWANKCVWKHSMGATGDYGENLAAGSGDSFGITDAINLWAAEESQYDPKNPQYSHYTQMVWKATKTLGCHTTTCDTLQGLDGGPMQFIVCNYDPPGNVEGEFGDNVQ